MGFHAMPCFFSMNHTFSRRLIVTLLCCVLASSVSFGRLLQSWPWEKLIAESDMVVVIQAIEELQSKDEYPGDTFGHPQTDFDASTTRFKVLGTLKPATPAPKELSVLHFNYSKRVRGVANGAMFIRFPIGQIAFERRELKDDKPTGDVEHVQYTPKWIAFLKLRSDGRYEPVTGHYDAAMSFREIK
jgi:hypothetical protein